jgi:hypothetical protein
MGAGARRNCAFAVAADVASRDPSRARRAIGKLGTVVGAATSTAFEELLRLVTIVLCLTCALGTYSTVTALSAGASTSSPTYYAC